MRREYSFSTRPSPLRPVGMPAIDDLGQGLGLVRAVLPAVLRPLGLALQMVADRPFGDPEGPGNLAVVLSPLRQDLNRHDLLPAKASAHGGRSPPSRWLEGGRTPVDSQGRKSPRPLTQKRTRPATLEARIKLATEARNVREYVSAKLEQLANPGLVLMGDCNDGPGQDLFETRYLFFDLIQNLQEELLEADEFFNHALFDFPDELSWTAKFRDEVLDIPASENPLLLDHILMSQPLARGELAYEVNAGAGRVEHEAFERANAGSNSDTRSSDHRPISCRFDETSVE